MTEIQSAIRAFPENWSLIIAGLVILFALLAGLAALFRSQKGGE